MPSPRTRRRNRRRNAWGTCLLAGILCAACQSSETKVEDIKVQAYEQRMTREQPFTLAPELTTIDAPPPVELTGQVAPTEPSLDAAMWTHLPDPDVAPEVLDRRLKTTRFSESIRREYEIIYQKTKKYILDIKRPQQFRLSLADALHRTLANNYQIKIDGYAPAIATAQIVQAEASFDTAFFANANRNNTDQLSPLIADNPTTRRLFETDTTIVNGGIRKLLATGATVTLTQAMTRTDNPGVIPNQFNPQWSTNFIAELRQPILRNFGIDFNRAQINISKNQRKINEQTFRATVIQALRDTEEAYWTLVAARRDVVISAEILAQAVLTYEQVKARGDFDAYKTLLSRSEANVKQREFDYIDAKNRVGTGEDRLLNLINDPDLPLSIDMEIIPLDSPATVPIVRDRFAAVQSALEHRPEIIQARHTVDTARLQLGIAKNQALPQLDVIYRMTVNGLGRSADRAFDKETSGNFIDQFVGMELLWSFGERRERAGIRIAELQQSQAVGRYKQALDAIITDCRVSFRTLETNYQQLTPSYQGVIAAAENLRSLQERQERKSPAELDTILTAQTSLAAARRALLQAAANYNIGMVDVERAKGTLLEYNNVMLREQP